MGKQPFMVLSSILFPASAAFLRILALLQIRDPHMVLALACPAILQGAIAAHLAALDLHLSHDLGGITFASADSCSVRVLFAFFVLLVLCHFPQSYSPFLGSCLFCLNFPFYLEFCFSLFLLSFENLWYPRWLAHSLSPSNPFWYFSFFEVRRHR